MTKERKKADMSKERSEKPEVAVNIWHQSECYDCGWVGDAFDNRSDAARQKDAHECLLDSAGHWKVYRDGSDGELYAELSAVYPSRTFKLVEV